MARPWSLGQLRRLGECLREGQEIPDGVPPYRDVMVWYNELATRVQQEIRSIDFSDLIAGGPEVTSRAKTIDTLREKLVREPTMALASIQDIAGVRLDAAMALSTQNRVAERIAMHFGHDPVRSIKDLRSQPHSGYRAVHLWLRLDDGRVEVQVRTDLQSAWANMYESAGDAFGRAIRYGSIPDAPDAAHLVRGLLEISDAIARIEEVLELAHQHGHRIGVAQFEPGPDLLGRLQLLLDELGRAGGADDTLRLLDGARAGVKAALDEVRYALEATRSR